MAEGRQIKKPKLSASAGAISATDDVSGGAGTGLLSNGLPTNILQLLPKETESREKTRKEHQHERKKLQKKLAILIKAKSKKKEKTVVKEIWASICGVIPTTEKQIPCYTKKCFKNAAVSWASNLSPEDN